MPADTKGQAFIEVDRSDHVHPGGVEVTWLPRDGVEAGKSTALFDAITAANWWDGTCFAWVAGYWRYTEPVIDESGEVSGAGENAGAVFHELTEIIPGVAVRVAVTLGLGRILNGRRVGLDGTDGIVAESGADRTGLRKLLRYLAALNLVDVNDEGYTLTRLGAEMDSDHAAEHLTLTGIVGRRKAGLLGLLAAVRTGDGDYARWFDGDFEDLVQASPDLLRQRTEQWSDSANWAVAPPLQEKVFESLGSVRVSGRAAADITLGLVDTHPELTVHLLATPAELDAATTVHPALADNPRIVAEPGSPLTPPSTAVDATVLSGGLGTHPDADAVHVLRQAAGTGGTVLVYADVLDEATAHDHDYEDDLLDFTLHCGGSRTDAENRELFAAAGLQIADQFTVG